MMIVLSVESDLAISVASIPPKETPTITASGSVICSFSLNAYCGRDSFFNGFIHSIKMGLQNDRSRKEKALLSAPSPLIK